MLPNILIPTNEANGAKRPSVVLAPSSVAMRQDVFGDALLDKALAGNRRKPVDWLISAGLHIAVVAAVVIAPLLFTQALDMSRLEVTYLAAPPTPYAPPPPPPAAAMAQQAAHKPVIRMASLTMPVAIPKTVQMLHDAPDYSAAESLADVSAGVPGGVAGGVPGGVLGGILGGSGVAAPPPPPAAVAVASNKPLHIGGEVKAPRAISTPQPAYPMLALQARIEGDVKIDAVIDQNGNVVQMHALSGPPLLINAALKAVSNWKYQPTVLNGQPYPVELTVDVTFQLS